MDGELLSQAIVKIKQKQTALSPNNAPAYIHEGLNEYLYDMLEVEDNYREDEETTQKLKYIQQYLKSKGSPIKILRKILIKLGKTPLGERKLDRVYRWIRLMEDAQEMLRYHNLLREEANAISNRRRKR